MSYNNIYAGIVTYNPDIEVLTKNIESLSKQVNEIVIFDNYSNNILELVECFKSYQMVKIIKSDKNTGIAFALNRLMQYGLDNQYIYMLTLDQDSYCSSDFIEKMLPAFEVDKNIKVITPVIKDKDSSDIIGHYCKTEKFSYVRTCISSGAIVNISAWNLVGRYDEAMFIDNVDIDFCYRIWQYGYSILQVNEVFFKHKIGDYSVKKIGFFKVKVFGHSSFRKYYIARNNIYCPLKNGFFCRTIYGNFKNLKILLCIIMFEANKKDKIKRFIHGWIDGYKVGK